MALVIDYLSKKTQASKLCIECYWCRSNTTTTYRCDLHRLLCFEANSEACGEWRARGTEQKGDKENEHREEGE